MYYKQNQENENKKIFWILIRENSEGKYLSHTSHSKWLLLGTAVCHAKII
jgi:hypothetical protein